MKRDGGAESGSGNSDGSCAAFATGVPRRKLVQCRSVLATLRYGSANALLVLCAVALVIGGWAIGIVLALAMVLGSFADEVSGDDDKSLKQSRCLFCAINLYLTLPLVSLLALLLVRFAAERQSLAGNLWETIVRARRSHGRA